MRISVAFPYHAVDCTCSLCARIFHREEGEIMPDEHRPDCNCGGCRAWRLTLERINEEKTAMPTVDELYPLRKPAKPAAGQMPPAAGREKEEIIAAIRRHGKDQGETGPNGATQEEGAFDSMAQHKIKVEIEPAAGPDPINPDYYKRGGLEVVDVIEAFDLNWRLGTAVKYILRAGHKGDRIEDLKKCLWYITREINAKEKPPCP